MKHETQNVFRFRRVKWGNPRHALNALRNKEPVFIDEAPPDSGRLFWVLVVLLVISVFASVLIIGGQHQLFNWT